MAEDLELKSRGATLKCSLFMPKGPTITAPVPCVVYCHGNSGNRCEGVEVMAALLVEGMAVFTFDFLGCGQSDGDYVTLGVGVRALRPTSTQERLKSRVFLPLPKRVQGSRSSPPKSNESLRLSTTRKTLK
jgi:hypothetical protein